MSNRNIAVCSNSLKVCSVRHCQSHTSIARLGWKTHSAQCESSTMLPMDDANKIQIIRKQIEISRNNETIKELHDQAKSIIIAALFRAVDIKSIGS